eukprot:1149671-Pelagomonas_calceolata.AAC.8
MFLTESCPPAWLTDSICWKILGNIWSFRGFGWDLNSRLVDGVERALECSTLECMLKHTLPTIYQPLNWPPYPEFIAVDVGDI